MTRPDLFTAVGAKIDADRAADQERTVRLLAPAFADQAARLDTAAQRAADDPAWFAGQPDHTRTAIATWRAYRANNPKDAA